MFVLVASPMVGPAAWQWLARALERQGHAVVVPELASVDGPRPVWPAHVARIVEQIGTPPAPVVLVGHSAAGRLIPLVAERVDTAACVFLDALLPGPPADDAGADDWFLAHVRALAVDGRLGPWSTWWGEDAWEALVPDPARREALDAALPRVPLAAVEETPAAPTTWSGPAAYLRLSAVYGDEAAEATRRGWPVAEIRGGHLHFAVEEDEVADALVSLVLELGR
ncbi:MAG: alpha/beta fold hydrolase [Acidimicrobiia bacterium]